MSDYFAGLIRAAGLAPAPVRASASLEASPEAATVATQPPAVVAIARQTDVPVTRFPDRPLSPAPVVQAATTVNAAPTELPPVATGEHSQIVPSTPASRLPDPLDLEAALQAALRWVTEGAEKGGDAAVESDPKAANAEPKAASVAAPIPAARAVPLPAPRAVANVLPAPPRAPEAIEVSIGEIHLRVDAPAPQLVARAPASLPRTSAADPPRRSGLARRAIGRF